MDGWMDGWVDGRTRSWMGGDGERFYHRSSILMHFGTNVSTPLTWACVDLESAGIEYANA